MTRTTARLNLYLKKGIEMTYVLRELKESDLINMINKEKNESIKTSLSFLLKSTKESGVWDLLWSTDEENDSHFFYAAKLMDLSCFLFFYKNKFYEISVHGFQVANEVVKAEFSKNIAPDKEIRLEIEEKVKEAFIGHEGMVPGSVFSYGQTLVFSDD